jgi:hypothetical protein
MYDYGRSLALPLLMALQAVPGHSTALADCGEVVTGKAR